MRDAGTAIRKAYFEALDNKIFIEGAPVPVVDEKLDEQITEQDIYITLSTQSENVRSNKVYFASEINISVVIVQRSGSAVNKSTVEYVSDEILKIALPSVGNNGLTIDSPFRLTYVKQDTSQTEAAALTLGSFVVAKQLNFRNRITQ